MHKVSAIVAVYQVEKYITQCLESLEKQTLQDFEVILVDDGSLDQSGKICDEYARRDRRFRVFHKNNEGVGSARQFGLEQSTGEYIIHVDPDDWIESNMFEELYASAEKENADIVICDYFFEFTNKKQYKKQEPDLLTENGYFNDLVKNKLYGCCWNKLVRKSCIEKYKISFDTNMVVWEDKLLNLKLAENQIKIAYLPKAFYHYVARQNSAVRYYSRQKVYSIIHFIDWLEKRKNLCDEKDILNFKIFAKQEAFATKSISKDEFMKIYPELNKSLSFKLSHIGRSTNFYIIFALKTSFSLFRTLYFFKLKISNKRLSKNLIK